MKNLTELLSLPIELVRKTSPYRNVFGTEKGVRMNDRGTFIADKSLEIGIDQINDYINLHQTYRVPKLLESHYMYLGEYPITYNGSAEIIPEGMPDNRLVVNFAKYIVDTFNGYFIGIPPKISADDDNVTELVNDFFESADLSDNLAELSKICSIYGYGYAFLYTDENGEIQCTYNSPLDIIMVHSDTIDESPRFAIRYYVNHDNETCGELYTQDSKFEFNIQQKILKEVEYFNVFNGLPLIEFVENDFRQSIFEQVKNLINHFNKALSSKANDIEYFANTYMKIIGAKVGSNAVTTMQKQRVINVTGQGSDKVLIDFITKPDSDNTQENLLERLQKLIFVTSMVANTTDENFGNTSGVALEFKLQNMHNLAIAKERKFTSGLKQLFKLWANTPLVPVDDQAYKTLKYKFTLNIPRNVSEEIENAKNLEGIVSKETQLSQLSFVTNPLDEMEKIEKEKVSDFDSFNELSNVSIDNPTGESILDNSEEQ